MGADDGIIDSPAGGFPHAATLVSRAGGLTASGSVTIMRGAHDALSPARLAQMGYERVETDGVTWYTIGDVNLGDRGYGARGGAACRRSTSRCPG